MKTATEPKRARVGPGGDRRSEILAAALELFSQCDYSSITIKDIARLAGVNTSLLYYYFSDKEALFRSALEQAVTDVMDKYSGFASKHTAPVDLIDDWFQMHIDLAPRIRRLVKILMDYSSSGLHSRVLDDVIGKFYDVEVRILSAAVKRGQQDGLFTNAVSPVGAAHFASTYLDGVMARSIIIPKLDVEASVNALREAFWAYLGYARAKKK